MEFRIFVVNTLQPNWREVDFDEIEAGPESERYFRARKYLVFKDGDNLILMIGPKINREDEYQHEDMIRFWPGQEIMGGGIIVKVDEGKGPFFLLYDTSGKYGNCYDLLQEEPVAKALKKAFGYEIILSYAKMRISL